MRCGKTSSESQPLDGIRIEHKTVVQIVKLLTEGVGVRSAARIIGCDPHTVLGVLQVIGQKCEALHDRLSRNIETGSLQIDELWARVRCSQKRANVKTEFGEVGDFYSFLALTAREKFIVSHFTGKRNEGSTAEFVADVAKRIKGRIQITTDAWAAYPQYIRHHLLPRLDYAVMQKNYATPAPQVEAKRRYSPAPFAGVTIRVKAGAPRKDRICTSHVERANLTVRHFNRRFARLGLCYSKTLTNHRYAIALFVCAYNFCKVHNTLGCTPAVGLKLASETWTVERLIEEATK